MQPFSIAKFPQAILHIDGDSFFAACEVAQNPALKGKPVITGLERGIISSLTYEAKALGLKRAMSLTEAKKICPQAILLPSDYETYSLYSGRMYNIVRRYTSAVEEYSIDECFADLTGLRRPWHLSYEALAAKIKKNLDIELGLTFSVGLAPTKVLAKVASKWKKPDGLTVIPANQAHLFLAQLPVQQIWGVGAQTAAYLQKFGIVYAGQFAQRPEDWVRKYFTKPHQEIWQELRGQAVYGLTTQPKDNYQSISKTKTFTPASVDPDYVFSQLAKNVENACIKARRHRLATNKIFFFLKDQEFKYHGWEARLNRRTNLPTDIIPVIRQYYFQLFQSRHAYRATGIILADLTTDSQVQLDLFCQPIKLEKITRVFAGADQLSAKYGKHTIFLGASFAAMTGQRQNDRQVFSQRAANLLPGETVRKHLGLPLLGRVN